MLDLRKNSPRACEKTAEICWETQITMQQWGPPSGGWQGAGNSCVPWQMSPSRRRRPKVVARSAQTGSSSTGIDDDPKHKLQRTEAVLVLSRGPLTTRKLAALAGLADATEARTLIRQLNQLYDDEGRAFRAEEVAGGYQLLTRPQFAPYLRRLGHTPQVLRLSSPMLETLAIVAYRQPTLRADIEAIRGVQSGELLRQLMERDLVRISGRSEELGRPYLYSTTKHFLQVFGLRNAEALPLKDWFNQNPIDLVESSSQDSALVSDSPEKESDVSIAIATGNLDSAPLTDPTLAVVPASDMPAADAGISAVEDEEEWESEEWSDDDDEDDEDEDDDWDESDGEWVDDEDEDDDGDDEEEFGEEDGEWEEVGDDDGDEEDDWGDDDEEDYGDEADDDEDWSEDEDNEDGDEDDDDWGDEE